MIYPLTLSMTFTEGPQTVPAIVHGLQLVRLGPCSARDVKTVVKTHM